MFEISHFYISFCFRVTVEFYRHIKENKQVNLRLEDTNHNILRKKVKIARIKL